MAKNTTKAVASTKSTKAAGKVSHAASNVIIATAMSSGAETITTPAAANKAAIAREIFQASYDTSPVPARKDIIARAVAEAGLTKAGAATYLQNYRRQNGMINSKAAVATA